MIDLTLALQLFVLINPFSTFPYLLDARSKGLDVGKVALQGVLIAFGVAASMAIAGPWLFRAFDVTLDAFRVAGGIVVLLLGIETIRSGTEEKTTSMELDSVTTVLATPLLTGPATISFVTLRSAQRDIGTLLVSIAVAFAMVGAVFFVFWLAIDRINRRVVTIVSKVLGLFLTAVAIQMIAAGVSALLEKR